MQGCSSSGLCSDWACWVGAELVLRLIDQRPRADLLGGFVSIVPVFERSTDAQLERLSAARRLAAAPSLPEDPLQSFPTLKRAGVFRIFAIGGSSTFGTPYRPSLAFPGWLA